MNNFFLRALGGVIIITLLCLMNYFSGWFLFLSFLLISSGMTYELCQALRKMNFSPSYAIVLVGNALFAWLFFTSNLQGLIVALGAFVIIVAAQVVILDDGQYHRALPEAFIILYISFLFGHMLLLRDSIYIWWIYILSFGTDTFAYLAGLMFGKHKLIPKLSPKKTIEGAIGGILGSVILTFLFAIYFKLPGALWITVSAIVGSVIAQIGDLTASSIKRQAKIKDFGHIIIGHGGFLDRFDSVLLVSPFVYYISILIK